MFLKTQSLWRSPRVRGHVMAFFRQSCWSDHNEVKTGGCTYLFSLFIYFFFLSCHFICSNASCCWVFLVANFLLSLNMYHLITFQLFLKETFCHMQSNQHQSEKNNNIFLLQFLFYFKYCFVFSSLPKEPWCFII